MKLYYVTYIKDLDNDELHHVVTNSYEKVLNLARLCKYGTFMFNQVDVKIDSKLAEECEY